jgi:hypothetical protein
VHASKIIGFGYFEEALPFTVKHSKDDWLFYYDTETKAVRRAKLGG